MSNQKTIFIHILNKEKEKKLQSLCKELKVSVKCISRADLDRNILSIVASENEDSNSISPESIIQKDSLSELLIFSGFDEASLKGFLDEYKKRGIEKVALKAMVTPYNLMWTLRELIEHLQEEHSRVSG